MGVVTGVNEDYGDPYSEEIVEKLSCLINRENGLFRNKLSRHAIVSILFFKSFNYYYAVLSSTFLVTSSLCILFLVISFL